jgi:ABC-2 type transport system permease protein
VLRSLRIIFLLAGKHLRVLARSKATLAVIFLPGIVLYSIFTGIFSGPAGRPFRVAVIDHDQTAASRALIDALAENRVRLITTENESPDGKPLTEEAAIERIRSQGKFRVALVIPEGYANGPTVVSGARHAGVVLYHDKLEPIEAEIVEGMIQMAAGRQYFRDLVMPAGLSRGRKDAASSGPADEPDARLVRVDRRDVTGHRMKIAAKHTFLAGIIPMMLLFSAAGAARGLLEELRSGEVRRLLVAPIHGSHVLLAQLVSTGLLAVVQCYVMYVFAWLVYGVEIWAIAPGLLVLTFSTALAVSGFGVMLGSFCRRTEQIDSLGTVVVMAMSAIGGSMVPRWIMPDWMNTFGLLTINAWAYDAFMGLVQGMGLPGIVGPCAVLGAVGIGCAAIGCQLLSKRLQAAPVA